MTSKYTLDFTDLGSFTVSPYTTNGPVSPNDGTLDVNATYAATTLLLYGKGAPNYGERIQENLVHMLENFASSVEPVFPIGGQMWLNRSATPEQLMVFNTSKHEIKVDSDNPTNVAWIALTPSNSSEQAEMLARFVDSFRIRIFNTATGQFVDHFVGSPGATVNGTGDVHFNIGPVPPSSYATGDWFVGGWEYVLHNNSEFHGDLDANGWTVANLVDPTNPQDAATKNYVDSVTLSDLADATITGIADKQIIVYDSGTGQWVNTAGGDIFLKITGGTRTLGEELYLSRDPNSGDPSNIAATKGYVDAEVAAVAAGAATDLGSLSDVTLSGTITTNAVLRYNGINWENISISNFISTNNIVPRSGTTMTGDLYLLRDPIPGDFGNLAATKAYVDAEVASVAASAQDGVVDGGSYDPISQDLTLTRASAGSPPLADVVINLTGAGGTADSTTYTIPDPNDWLITEGDSTGFAFESLLYDRPLYPAVTLTDALDGLNDVIGELVQPRGSLVFTSNGGSVVNLDIGTVTGQCNPAMTISGPLYSVGSHRLSVYVNGQKYISSPHGKRVVTATLGSPEFFLWPGSATGLNPANTYTFDISVNGQAAVTVSVSGADAQNIGMLADAINALTETNYHTAGSPADPKWAFGVRVFDGAMHFYSCLPGTGSSIDLTDGSVNPLFSSMVGDAGSTGAFTIADVTTADTTPYTPADYGYKEIGRVGKQSQLIEFVSPVPPSGSVIEILIEPDMFAESINVY